MFEQTGYTMLVFKGYINNSNGSNNLTAYVYCKHMKRFCSICSQLLDIVITNVLYYFYIYIE